MIKNIKRIIKKMIEIGNSIISSLCIGSNTSVVRIDVEDTKVWPETAPATTLSISPTTIVLNPGDSSQGYITVTTNASSWNVASSDFGKLSVTKYSSTQVFWTIGNNDTTSNRNFTITVTAGDRTAQATVLQYPGYVIYVVGGSSTRYMENTGGSIQIQVVSQHGSQNQPFNVTTSQSWCTASYGSVDNTTHTYTYYLTFGRNDGAQRNVTITFSQTTGVSTSIMYIQYAAAADIPGLTSVAKYGNWVLGEYTVGRAGPNNELPVTAILLATTDTLTTSVTVNFDINISKAYFVTNNRIKTSSYSATNLFQTISQSNTVTIEGTTYSGTTLVIPNVSWQKTGTDIQGDDTWEFVSTPGINYTCTPQPGHECGTGTQIRSVQ